MRVEPVEIFSDASNGAVLRHPGRRYPGCLIQADSLHAVLESLQRVQHESGRLTADAAGELSEAAERLTELLEHDCIVMQEHGMDLPFRN